LLQQLLGQLLRHRRRARFCAAALPGLSPKKIEGLAPLSVSNVSL
jgi:hypothetical protein